MRLDVVGIPFHLGKDNPTVADAPEFLRQNNLFKDISKKHTVKDHGDWALDAWPEQTPATQCERIAREIFPIARQNSLLVVLGGDHGMALGTMHGILEARPDTIVVWIDAHADMNTPESSLSGNFHGMPLSYLLPYASISPEFSWVRAKLPPRQLIMLGLRDVDEAEEKFLKDYNICQHSTKELQEHGMAQLFQESLEAIDPLNKRPIHVSLDVDILEPKLFAATGTPAAQGLEQDPLLEGLKAMARTGRLRSIEFVEFAPGKQSPDIDLRCAELVKEMLEAIVSTRPG